MLYKSKVFRWIVREIDCTCLIVYFMPMYCFVNIMFLRAVLITDNLVCVTSLFIPLKVGCFGTGMEQHLTWVLL